MGLKTQLDTISASKKLKYLLQNMLYGRHTDLYTLQVPAVMENKIQLIRGYQISDVCGGLTKGGSHLKALLE